MMRLIFISAAYLIAYVLLDWISYIHPLGQLAITPWNPPPGLSIALLLTQGMSLAPILFVGSLAADMIVRGIPTGLATASMTSLVLTIGYSTTAWLLRDLIRLDLRFMRLRDIGSFVGIISTATLVIAATYISVHVVTGHIPSEQFIRFFVQFWVGDVIGILVTTPVLILALQRGYRKPRRRVYLEVALQSLSVLGALWCVFGIDSLRAPRFFYVLFLPLVWISVRHGIRGAAAAILAIQLGIIGADHIVGYTSATVLELQFLMLALAVTGLFLGAVVSDRLHTQEELDARDAELHRALRFAAATETASALAHELNQPLTAIANYVRACVQLLDRPAENRARLDETMRTVTAEVARAGQVVQRMREFFRSGTSQLEPLAITEVLDSVCMRLRQRLERHRIALRLSIAPQLPAVLADRVQLETVLHNLFANAIDSIVASNAEQRDIALEARLVGPQSIKIIVADSGPGIPVTMMDRMFTPFATTKPDGMGLGLAISRSIIEHHGGRLAVESCERGAAFSFTLPVEVPEQVTP